MSNSSSPKQPPRPRPLHVSRSFTRLEANPESLPPSPSRARASTIQTIPEAKDIASFSHGDVFESVDEEKAEEPTVNVPATWDQLPIEIRSLSERFFKSLSVKTHANPLNIDTISELFQDFYEQAESHISTHIATLSTRLSREKSPSRSAATKALGNTLKGRKQSAEQAVSPNGQGEQQMLTASEVADRRKARRDLEIKRLALEEAVERAVCEKVYDRIYRHRSADDEERDAKLRSRTAALSLVGIGLKELHVDIEPAKGNGLPTDEKDLHDEIFKLLAPARDHLRRMDDHHYPLGKLQMLTEAHKSIVETLSRIFPSTSSADEVLPTLIYTLMTSEPETINVISNLHFVQHFRARAKVDGEAAYCLVNLEAAISFLETVDLSSLRADEAPQGGQHPETRHERSTDLGRPSSPRALAPGLTTTSAISSDISPGDTSIRPLPSQAALETPSRPGLTQRRFSSLIQAQAERIEAGRDELMNSADQAFDAINSTLENSFKFLFGRMKEQGAGTSDSPIVMPRTLEDARKLVSSPPLVPIDSHPNFAESLSASPTADPLTTPRTDNTMLNLVGGRLRERSVDSNRSAGSGKRVIFAEKPNLALTNNGISSALPSQSAVESMGNLMNSINPLSRFGGFGKFGRSASASGSSTPTTPAASTAAMAEKTKQLGHIPESEKSDGTSAVQPEPDLDALEALALLKKATPPIQKFVEAKNAQDLRIKDVDELLKDYQRLAALINETINT
ncbi:hypothetical protein E4T42_08789 [Aureobasidium subglaciale]|nr:hypothetical protein E4T42_08789 [Aureobasidium subglaciale]